MSRTKGYEAKIYKEFNEEEELKYSESFQKKIQNILDDIEDDQKEKYNDKLFFKNTKLIMISIIASIICVTFSVIAGIIVNQFAALEYLSQLMLIIPIAFFIAFITSIIGSLKRNKSIVLIIILVIFLIVPFIMVAFAAMVSILNFIMEFSLNVWSFCAVLVDNIVFYKLIRRYSEEGLRIKEDIEGFKMFIKTAKDDDFKEKTPEMFDKYFPYAYVLGLENKWASKFEDVLKESNYSPDWCTYAMFNSGTFNVTAFTNSFSSSFSSGMSSASTVPSSSGGSGGGGFSGGGGGGRRPEEAGNRAI